MHETSRAEEQEERDNEAVTVGGAPVDVEAECAEQRRHLDAEQSIDAAGNLAHPIGKFKQKKPDGRGDHEPRQILATHDEEAREISAEPGAGSCSKQSGDRFA